MSLGVYIAGQFVAEHTQHLGSSSVYIFTIKLSRGPAPFLGFKFSAKIPMNLAHEVAAAMFALMGLASLLRIDDWLK